MSRPVGCRAVLAGVSLVALAAGCAVTTGPADLVLLNGKLVTMNPERPEARALAARDGRIVAVGDDDEIRDLVGESTRVIDLEGRLAIPGFIEGHGHFDGVGRARRVLDLRSADSWEEIVEIAAGAAAEVEPGEWIVGWGWHQEKWRSPVADGVEGYPTHAELSRVAPDNPVLFRHAAGSHAGIVNRRAMEEIGIDDDTPDPEGGRIVRDPSGRPTGFLREAAYRLAIDTFEEALARRTPERVEADAREEIELAEEECLRKGITTFQDAGSGFETIDRFRAMAEAGELGIRLWVMIEEEIELLEERIADYRMVSAGDGHLTVRAIKAEIDGALGSHTAWLLEPYSDRPESTGLNTTPTEQLERVAEIAMKNGFQLCVHAIGDRGNRETLDLFQRAFERHPGEHDLRWRVEHAQHLDPQEIPRFSELGVIASVQGVHSTSDGPWVPERLGAARSAEGAYVWRKLIDSGAVVINGTDAPVEDVSPIANFHASVTREMADGAAFHPDQRMTRMEALRSYTLDAAYAAFEEEIKGSLVPGKLADVTVLSRDILTVPDDEIPGTEVLYTIVGGHVLYEKLAPERSSGDNATR